MTNLTERLEKHINKLNEYNVYKDEYYTNKFYEPDDIIPIGTVYEEMINNSKFKKFKVKLLDFSMTDKDASWYSMKGFGHTRDDRQKIIEWSSPHIKQGYTKQYKVYLGFKDCTEPIEDIKFNLRLEMMDNKNHLFGTDSFPINPKGIEDPGVIADKVFNYVIKHCKEGVE